MKYISVLAIAILSIFFIISCKNTKQQPAAEASARAEQSANSVKEKIESINKILEKATLNGDYDTMLKYYADDIIVCPDLNPPVKGKAALEEAYDKEKRYDVKYHSFSGTIDSIWECGDKIYERGTFGMSYSSKKHKKPEAYYGSYFSIWQKEGGDSLKIKYAIWNLDFNPWDN